MTRIAVVKDIHGNLAALQAVAADFARRGVHRVNNLGDSLSGPLLERGPRRLGARRDNPAPRNCRKLPRVRARHRHTPPRTQASHHATQRSCSGLPDGRHAARVDGARRP